jgi:Putative endonuclease segE, GIY-YIG domain
VLPKDPRLDVKVSRRTGDHWEFPGGTFNERGCAGFVYVIVEIDTGRKYIGRKNYKTKNGKQYTDWRNYTGSSGDLNKLIAVRGLDAFKFIVLEQYFTLGGVSWGETFTQVIAKVPERSAMFFNVRVEGISWPSKEHITELHKKNIKEYVL